MLLASTLLPATVPLGPARLPICCLLHACRHGSCPSLSVVQVEDHGSTPSVGGGAHCRAVIRMPAWFSPQSSPAPGKTGPRGFPVLFQCNQSGPDLTSREGRGRCSPSPDCHPGPCQDNGNMDYACMSPHMVLSEGQSPHLAFRR